MSDHKFLFTPKKWLGEGKITLSASDEELDFFTRWSLGALDADGQIPASQEVQIKGISDVMINQFIISDITGSSFVIELDNAAIGNIIGKGIIKDNLIAWEFTNNDVDFEGFEFYEKQEDGSYLLRAEYATPDQYRTTIKGKIWERMEEDK